MSDQIKKFWKPFLIFFALAFLVINWNDISWIFNYRAVSRYISYAFEKKEIETQQSVATATVKNAIATTTKTEEKTQVLENRIEIPKIQIEAPVTIDKTLDDQGVYKALDIGTVFYPSSVLPGETGQTIILGHSAPANWPHIKYDWVFSDISKLEKGDEIFVYLGAEKLSYSVIGKIFLERGEEIPEDGLTNSKNVLVLVSCWPPGKDLKRIAVEAVQK
jgi:LPXTG-site transpeptidase (sortase) family protein